MVAPEGIFHRNDKNKPPRQSIIPIPADKIILPPKLRLAFVEIAVGIVSNARDKMIPVTFIKATTAMAIRVKRMNSMKEVFMPLILANLESKRKAFQ